MPSVIREHEDRLHKLKGSISFAPGVLSNSCGLLCMLVHVVLDVMHRCHGDLRHRHARSGGLEAPDLLEQVYRAGLVHMDLHLILVRLAAPVLTILGLALTLPYVLVATLLPLFLPADQLMQSHSLILRRVYPSLLFASVLLFLVTWHVRKYWRLLEHIKNDKYLVGKRLVNCDPAASKAKRQAATANAAAASAIPAQVAPVAGAVN